MIEFINTIKVWVINQVKVVLKWFIKSIKNLFDFLEFDSKKIVHFIIILFFYLTIIAITISIGYKIYEELLHFLYPKENDLGDEVLMIFKLIEHIFLYLIPLFIIFGFFNYYKLDLKLTLLDKGRPQEIDRDTTTASIYLTKTLFLSSMMSYVIIKIIEKVFLLEKDAEFNYSILQLISYGVLLFMIMTYMILSHKPKK
jgi:hypothetical protein